MDVGSLTMNERGLPFAKMHGCGNDFVVVDAFDRAIDDPADLSRRMTDRRKGVGADGLLLALPSDRADFRMRMFNVDGSEAEMCGNGLRCIARFVRDNGLVDHAATLTAETGAGVLTIAAFEERDGRIESVTVDLGAPRLERADVPMDGPAGRVVDEPLDLPGQRLPVTALSMGNPHAVTWVDDVDAYPVERVGPLIERHPAFPQRTNAEFVELLSRTAVRQRTWERGCGETLACGTGAAAVAVASALTGRTDRALTVHLRGGDLHLEWDAATDHVLQTGPAVWVYEGVWPAV